MLNEVISETSLEATSTTHAIERRGQGKYTKQGTRKFSGWTNEGKVRWNVLFDESINRWAITKPSTIEEKKWPLTAFTKRFQDHWMRFVYRQTLSKNNGDDAKEEARNCFVTDFEEV